MGKENLDKAKKSGASRETARQDDLTSNGELISKKEQSEVDPATNAGITPKELVAGKTLDIMGNGDSGSDSGQVDVTEVEDDPDVPEGELDGCKRWSEEQKRNDGQKKKKIKKKKKKNGGKREDEDRSTAIFFSECS